MRLDASLVGRLLCLLWHRLAAFGMIGPQFEISPSRLKHQCLAADECGSYFANLAKRCCSATLLPARFRVQQLERMPKRDETFRALRIAH